ncbi:MULTISPECIES: LytTR family DNA-binding domain-containing protein [unclassified Paenibacillus]|uniref:LytR/AlgR family response regulator transcription factor n=1 Tax=unclassified Paenibacillus TaxID=185978 RepID=UPI002404AEC6|nr:MULTISPECIES: LytTR family DNA-binding domain-containing protein [unclassified Paenibacillus]MDF9845322.1 DNA-binding LytR/AlgR family response regulator [Paenibacillus sp. PastF-2]MDF9851904.1 DNA-binding LytR/AlgR family response regulator [Paenibacillus sp. PastM-2]MDF9858482.1 DNA-binding LytR/AlgR family response regulator [Paenibacillus sp. PastF-1]MDH6483734.1 DNA-binding LytR/AlgR family response regulator [Paenibacillus sp. PastH-2]MDH6511131.1 DNA-binding LytR/AlgR family response
MIHIAICDDDKQLTEQIEQLIICNQHIYGETFQIDIFYSGEKLIQKVKEICPYDLIFLDIEMKQLSGIEAGLILRQNSSNDLVQIIFISSHEKYHLQLFDVQPSGFINKPINSETFNQKFKLAIHKIVRRKEKERKKILFIQQKKNQIMIPFKNIIYLESNCRKIIVHTKEENLEYYSTLNHEENKLFCDEFIRIHQSYIVNLFYVKQLNAKKLILLNGQELPISEKQSTTVKSNFLNIRRELIGSFFN